MKRFKFLTVILSIMMFLGSFAACSFTLDSTHVCESVCEVCGNCMNAECEKKACKEKCECEEPAPEHTCESKCEDCEKCTNADCTEEACKNKCDCKHDQYELNIMSFNIRIPGSSGVQTWGSRKAAVMNFVNNSGADIIGLQEVSSTPYSDFMVNLASNYKLVYFQEHENLAIIYDATVFKLVSRDEYWLSETPDTRSYGWGETVRRMVAILILKHLETGEMVRIINTHGPLNDEANVKAFELIVQRSLSDDSDILTFMTGDFNAEPNKLGYVSIAEKLQDCRVVAEKSSNRENGTFHNWGAVSRPVILDYCFVSKSKNVKVLTYAVREDKWGDGNYISDHYAVQTTVRIYKNANNA